MKNCVFKEYCEAEECPECFGYSNLELMDEYKEYPEELRIKGIE